MAKKVKAKSAKKAAPAKKSGAAKKPATKAKAAKKPVAKKPVAKAAPKKSVEKKAPAKKVIAAPVKKVTAPAVKVATAKPTFTRPNSVIAKTAKVLPVDNRSRYSDAELKEFKVLIQTKLDEATRDYELLKNTLSHKDDHGTDDTSPTFKLLEDGSDVLSKEETAHLAARQEKYIQNLKNAQIRIANKTYGICRVTGKLIPKERLRSVPHATLSIDAKLGQSR
jgi:DnaK suppressor protein